MYFARLQAVYTTFDMKILPVQVGQLLEIHEIIGEWDNKRNRKFKCLVLSVSNPNHPSGTFTVRGVSSGVVIEKIYPLSFAKFAKVILLDEYKVRRSKIYYIRDKVWKGARMKSRITADRRWFDLLTLKRDAWVLETLSQTSNDVYVQTITESFSEVTHSDTDS